MQTKNKYFVSLLSLATSGLLIATNSFAQNPAFAPDSPWLFGDWNGKRTELEQQGYRFDLGYTGEMATLIHARDSHKHKTEYSDQFALGAQLNLEKILGWQDTEAQITITERNGRSLSQTHDALQGHLSSVQEVWGRGQTWRLTDLWIKKLFLDQKLDIKVGRFGEGEDFNTFDCDFQNLTFCGSQVGNWVGDQWYNWPVSQWAMRVKYQFQPELYGQVGIYEYNPENLRRSKGFNLSTDGSEGAIIPVELVWQPKALLQQLPGEYRLGYYYSTADANEIEHPDQTRHKQGMWLVLQQQLTQPEANSERGLKGFINLTVHDKSTNTVDNMQNIGLVYTGLTPRRPQDQLAIAFGRISINNRAQSGQNQEYDAEVYYGIHATNWLTLRPNIQYIRHVGGYKHGENVWVGGLKLQAAF